MHHDPAPLLLDGTEVPGPAELLDVVDPSSDAVVGRVPVCGEAEVEAAVAGAAKAAGGWARTPAGERSAALKAAARRLRTMVEEIAELQSREGGKPLGDSRGGVEAGIGTLEQYAELGPLHRGRSLQGGWDATDLMLWEPRGVCAVLTPWNDPVAITLQGVAAGLAVGNTVVFKPSERTPLSCALVASVLAAELPPTCCRCCTGTGAPALRWPRTPTSTSSTTSGPR
jgi:succinate-semialdehyde dehydrogenase / glutarate-semialdehyde dehydrogenase